MTAPGPLLTFEIVTLFPEAFEGFLGASLLGKAISAGVLAVYSTHVRSFGLGKHRSVDDTPYGGGPGMVMRCEPVEAAIAAATDARGPAHRILLSPQGRLFDQAVARDMATRGRVLLVCGRYEGIDDRVSEALCDEVLSVGDYVLSGGEVAAMVVIDAVARLVPGVLGRAASTEDESFSLAEGRLEYPHYTRPPVWRGLTVPTVLQSGDHAQIARWRRRQSVQRTLQRRPDLMSRHPLTEDEQRLLAEDVD